ncbi:MAG: hypothetical protein ACO20H_12360 [Bacteriovoracaceae bacterium]
MPKIYGFSFMRGVDKLDYPYLEMLESMSGLTEKIYLAIGDSDDATRDNIEKLKNVEIIPTIWEDKYKGDGGRIFSQQANIALGKLRDEIQDPEAWALFLHCDEIIHPQEYKKLLSDLDKAIKEGADAITVRFLHFWKDHYHIAVNKRWQPAEIRLFKLHSSIFCYGDAQGFKGFNKQIDSDVNLYHYGHVRPAEQHQAKQKEIMERIRPAEKFNKYWKREKKAFAKTKMLKINCHHPPFMRPRIERLHDQFNLPTQNILHIVGNDDLFDSSFLTKINVEKIKFHKKVSDVPSNERKNNMIILKPNLWERFLYKQPDSVKMDSPHAKDWSPEMELLLRISQKGFNLKESPWKQ